jgi:Mor family transcriptional regulator
MNFNQLDEEQKKQLHNKAIELATNLGGVNFFLQMIEDIKKEKPHALLNKSCVFHFLKR